MPAAKGKKNSLSGMSGTEFPYVHATLELAGHSWPEVAVRYKGNSTFMMSRGSLKRSMKIDLIRYTKDGVLAGVTTLNLHSGVADMSMMNETLSHRLYRDAPVPAPRTAAQVFVTVAGKYERKYLGLYSLVEDVDQSFLNDRYPAKGGALFKPVTRKFFEDLGPEWEVYGWQDGWVDRKWRSAGGFPGPGMMLGRMIFPKFDTNRDGTIAGNELKQTLGRWFESWNADGSGQLTAEQLKTGIMKDLLPAMPFGPPGMGEPGIGMRPPQ